MSCTHTTTKRPSQRICTRRQAAEAESQVGESEKKVAYSVAANATHRHKAALPHKPAHEHAPRSTEAQRQGGGLKAGAVNNNSVDRPPRSAAAVRLHFFLPFPSFATMLAHASRPRTTQKESEKENTPGQRVRDAGSRTLLRSRNSRQWKSSGGRNSGKEKRYVTALRRGRCF